MSEFKALGKKPPKITLTFPKQGLSKFEICQVGIKILAERDNHYCQTLLEAAEELRNFYCPDCPVCDPVNCDSNCCKQFSILYKKLRISAGVEEK